jgi:hypothetical protein
VTIVDADLSSGRVTRLAWVRGGLLLGLLFLIGPISDLVNASDSPARTTAIAVLLATFVALYQQRSRICLPGPFARRPRTLSATAAPACAGSTFPGTRTEVALQVDNDGAPARIGSDNGTGLAGLAERARRLEGTLDSGARPEGGFHLLRMVPLPS